MTDQTTQPKTETALTVDPQAELATHSDADVPSSGTPSSATSLGGRVRKTTQKFTFVESKGEEPEEFSPPTGKGVKLRDIEFACSNVEALGKKQHDMIKQLYSIMYGRRFQQKNLKLIKEHILDFSGIVEQDEKSRENLFAKMGKWKRVFVHEVMDLLAVDRSKKSFDEAGKPHDKEALIDRLIDWLYNPQETKLGEKKAATAAKKAKQKANKRTKKAAGAKKTSEPAKKKRRTSRKTTAASDDEEEDDHEATESEGEESSSDFEEAKKPTKKRKATRQSKKADAEESDNEDDAEGDKASEVVAEKNDKDEEQPAAEPAAEPEEESTAVDKEEPKAEALGDDVCNKVRDIIAHGNAEELTVKKIVRQLSADLGRDMSAQKKAIKEFITNDQAEI